MTSDEAKTDPGEDARGIWRVGLEVPVEERTPPEVRPGPPVWEPYRGLQFSARVRAIMSVAILILPAFLVIAAVVQVVMGEGRERAFSVIMLMPIVVIWPLASWAFRDMWGRYR